MNKNTELHIFDLNDNHIISNYNISNVEKIDNNLSINIQQELAKLGFISGIFKIKLNYFDYFIGEKSGLKMTIDEISSNRLEVRLVIPQSYLDFETYLQNVLLFSELADVWSNDTTQNLVLNCFDNNLFHIVNIEQDKLTYTEYPFSIILKLNSKLPSKINTGHEVIISKPIINTLETTVKLIPTNISTTVNIMSNPNFDINIDNINKQDINFYSWEDLVTTDTTIANKIDTLFNTFNKDSVKLNIDFTDYSNFVFYSSAYTRLNNFLYKLKKIEQIESQQLLVSSSVYKSQYDVELNQIKTNFDYYDYYLYNVSSSYSYPKDIDNNPLPLDSTTAQSWITNQYDIAESFDNSNINKLTKTIPEQIILNESNSLYITFIEMIAQHFDYLYFYIQHLDDLRTNTDNIHTGLSSDLIYYALKSYGWNPIHDTQYDNLALYQLGITGSVASTTTYINALDDNLPTSDINKEIWNRIYNNLSYIYKTKGTVESIRALINCYGIPETILPVLEFGGPKKTEEISKLIKYKFNYALSLTGTEYITVPYYPLGTLEFRFRLSEKTSQTIFERADNNVEISFEPIESNLGVVKIITTSGLNYTSDEIPIYNGDFWHFAFRHNETTFITGSTNTYDIRLFQKKYDTIITNYSSSFSTDVGIINSDFFDDSFDYNLGNIAGNIQEFRYWEIPINDSTLENHALSPTSYNSNTVSGSYDYLTYRLPLGTDTNEYNHSIQTILSSQHPSSGSQLDANKIATFHNFSDKNNYDIVRENYVFSYPDISSNRTLSNKVRLEDNSLYKNLDVKSRSEVSSFDTQPLDDNKVGVYFSPATEVNQDISEHMAGVNVDDYLADENSTFLNNYPELTSIRNYYFKQYYGSYQIQDFLNSVEHYLPSLFKYIKQVTPARTNKLTGVTIEPHILNRSKVSPLNNAITIENTYNEGILDAKTYYQFDNEISYKMVDLNMMTSKLYGDMNDLSGIIYNPEYKQINEYQNIAFINGIMTKIEQDSRYTKDVQEFYYESIASERLKVLNPEFGFESLDKYIAARVNDFNLNTMSLMFKGSKISSPDFNIDSDDTPDGKPVIEIFETNDVTLISTTNNTNGNLTLI